jgi:NADPH:quinone reductase-like Zn-dependent oxidoreductase
MGFDVDIVHIAWQGERGSNVISVHIRLPTSKERQRRRSFMRRTRIIVTRYGGPEVLRVAEEECPEPKEGEVRVRVLASGVALPDVMAREGVHPETPAVPFTPGWDLVGVVERVGAGVSGIEPGQTVAAMPIRGAYADFVCLPQHELVPVPSGLDAAEVVSLVLNYITAYQMMHRSAKVRPGQRVLIHGAAGGVGTALLQLGRLAGLEMYGTCSARGAPVVSELGAIPMDYQHQDFVKEIQHLTGDGVDVVFDPIGGAHLWDSRKALRPWREGGGLRAHQLDSRGRIDLEPSRSSPALSWNRPLRAVHRRRLAAPRQETGGPLQHPDAQAAEAGMVSTGSHRPSRPPSTAKDQAARRAAISSHRGERGTRPAREGRRDGQVRARIPWVVAPARDGLETDFSAGTPRRSAARPAAVVVSPS